MSEREKNEQKEEKKLEQVSGGQAKYLREIGARKMQMDPTDLRYPLGKEALVNIQRRMDV